MPFVITTIDFNYEEASGSEAGGWVKPETPGRRGRMTPDVTPLLGSLPVLRDARRRQRPPLPELRAAQPGMWGFAQLLRNVGDDMGFATLVMWGCGALYLASLAADVEGMRTSGLLSLFSPSIQSLFLFGASGAVPSSATGAGGRC